MVLPSSSSQAEFNGNREDYDPDYMFYLQSLVPGSSTVDGENVAWDSSVHTQTTTPVSPTLPTPLANNIEAISCPICYEPFTNGAAHYLCGLPCGHLFGFTCIDKWLKNTIRVSSSECPLCKVRFTSKQIKKLFPPQFQFASLDEATKKRIEHLEAKCASLEKLDSVEQYIVESKEFLKEIKDKLPIFEQKMFNKIERKLDAAIAHQEEIRKAFGLIMNPEYN